MSSDSIINLPKKRLKEKLFNIALATRNHNRWRSDRIKVFNSQPVYIETDVIYNRENVSKLFGWKFNNSSGENPLKGFSRKWNNL